MILATMTALIATALPGGLLDTAKPSECDVAKLAGLNALVEKGITEQRYPGAVLIIGQPGKQLYAKAFGRMAYSSNSAPVKLDTIFDMASISKVVATSTAAMLLVEDGQLGLDEPVSKYTPGFEANGKQDITLRHLMTHVSGLQAYENKDLVEKERTPDETHADALIRHYAALTKSYTTGSKVVYSCLNLQTTARVVETITGQRVEDFVRERVWKPLGMSTTFYSMTDALRIRCAPTSAKPDGTPVQGEIHDPLANYHGTATHCPGNAGLFSTGEDLAHYAEMILNGGERNGKRVLKPETIRTMTTVHTPAGVDSLRGLGWDVYETKPYVTPLNNTPDSLVIGHTGYTGTLILLDKLSKTYVIFLTNRVFPSPATGGKEGDTIDPIRRQICDTVLRSLACYREVFGK